MRSRHSREELERLKTAQYLAKDVEAQARLKIQTRRFWEKKLGVDDLRTENARLKMEIRGYRDIAGALWTAGSDFTREVQRLIRIGRLTEKMSLNERLECIADDCPDGQLSYEYQRKDGYVVREKTMLETLQAALGEGP